MQGPCVSLSQFDLREALIASGDGESSTNAAAARLSVSRVSPISASSRTRSNCKRLVFIRLAESDLLTLAAFMASAPFHAITRLTATDADSSSSPSEGKKS